MVASMDFQGRFFVEGVPAGPLLLEGRGRPRVAVRGLEVVSGEVLAGEVRLGIGERSVRGLTSVAASGKPLGGARVIVKWSRSRGTVRSTLLKETRSGRDGRVEIEGLGPGSSSATVSAEGHQPRTLHFAIPPGGETVELLVHLVPSSDGATSPRR